MTMDEMIAERERLQRRRVVCALVVLLVGVGWTALGAHEISTNRYLLRHGVRTTGVVVAYERSNLRNGPAYFPRVRYVGPGNYTYVVEGGGNSTPQFRVGASVTVYYDPLDPATALVYGANPDGMGWAFIVVGCMFFFFFLVLVTALALAALDSPAVRRRRTLKLLHRLGGAALVWDAYDGGRVTPVIGGLHLQDTAGNRVPLPATWPAAEGRRPIEHDCAHDAHELAQHDSTEPGHYVLALPKGTVISTPAHLPAVEPEPTPPQAPLPAQPERTAESLAKEPSPLEQVMVGALLALLAGAVLLVVVVLLTGSLVIR